MKSRGGYNILLAGKPDPHVTVMPMPKKLYLPLKSQRFAFTDICVSHGEQINKGDTLAKDPNNYEIPLLAPLSGTIDLHSIEGHIVLENTGTLYDHKDDHAGITNKDRQHIVEEMGAGGDKRLKLLSLGAWQFFRDAHDTLKLPDPLGTPQAIIVSTLALEPFLARGDVQLQNRLLQFTRGLEHLQSLLEYQPIYLVLPKIASGFADRVRQQIRGYAWAKIIEIPLKYSLNHPSILARSLGLKSADGPVWSIRTEGVLAVDRALTLEKPCTVRLVSVAGPGVALPTHIKTMTGYPIEAIRKLCTGNEPVRMITGGMLTGETIGDDVMGLETECLGVTVLKEHTEREFLGFMRPGSDRESYAPCFLSVVRTKFREPLNTAVRGEGRPCISCNFCEEVCPARIMPHLIHKYLYGDLLEEADQARVDLCVQCGLCSFVCPSKIELRQQFSDALEQIAEEKEQIRLEEVRQQKLREEEEQRKSVQENG